MASTASRVLAAAMKRPLWQKLAPSMPQTASSAPLVSPAQALKQISPELEPLLGAPDAGHAPVLFARMNDEQQVIGARLDDGGTERHAPRQFQNTPLPRSFDCPMHNRLGPQFCGTLGDPGLNETAGNGKGRVEGAVIGLRVRFVENRFQGLQQRLSSVNPANGPEGLSAPLSVRSTGSTKLASKEPCIASTCASGRPKAVR